MPIVLADIQGSGIWRKVGSRSWVKASGFTTSGTGWPPRAEFAWLKGDTIVYAYDNTSGLWRSVNFGRSWTRISSVTSPGNNPSGFIAAVPGNQNQLVFSTASSVQLLTNAGSAGADGASGRRPVPAFGAARAHRRIQHWKAVRLRQQLRSLVDDADILGISGGWTSLADDTWLKMVRAPKELSVDANGTVYAALSGGALALRGG